MGRDPVISGTLASRPAILTVWLGRGVAGCLGCRGGLADARRL